MSPHRKLTEETRLLLVEDNPGDARLLRETLRDAPSFRCCLETVDRLSSAREVLAREPVDVILLDLSLPDAHGLDTISQAIQIAPEQAIVVLTGLDDETLALQAVQAGAQDYLVKGQVDGALLVRTIRYAMERKRLLAQEREARATAEAAARARDDVLHVVSHDLGNSLTAIRLHAALLERLKPESIDAEGVHRRATAIRQLVDQMHGLRQDLLDVASIEAGRLSMSPRPIPVLPVACDAAEAIAELTAEKSIELGIEVAEGLPDVLADRQRLLQVFSNLLGNAAKFTPAEGRIELRAERAGADVRFAVRDSGPGIPTAQLDRIFDRFWKGRADERTGAGLGLSITRGIVEAHGGSIGVESEEGRGATFWFTIPAAEAGG